MSIFTWIFGICFLEVKFQNSGATGTIKESNQYKQAF